MTYVTLLKVDTTQTADNVMQANTNYLCEVYHVALVLKLCDRGGLQSAPVILSTA